MVTYKINFNGKLFQADLPLLKAGNRAFRYGDGLFETIRVFEGQVPFLDLHFDRLEKGMRQLKIDIPENYSAVFFENEIQKLTLEKGNHRVRLTVFRSGGGHYFPKENNPQFIIECELLEDARFNLNPKGLHVGLFEEIKLAKSSFSNLKTCNSLPYVLAGIYCKENGFDDCFLLNSSGNIAECTSSNVFFIKENVISTPALPEACVEGTMRKLIIEIAKKTRLEVKETTIAIPDIHLAEEIWLTNAIHGIRWVENFGKYHFKNNTAVQFEQLLNEKIKSNY